MFHLLEVLVIAKPQALQTALPVNTGTEQRVLVLLLPLLPVLPVNTGMVLHALVRPRHPVAVLAVPDNTGMAQLA